jgi:hypothetical protein
MWQASVFGQATSAMAQNIPLLLSPTVIPFVLGGFAIAVGGMCAIIKSFMRHRERMAMIRAGMHPDAGVEADEGCCSVPKPAAKASAGYKDWSKPAV